MLKTTLFDSAEYLDTEEALQEYVGAACEGGMPREVGRAVGVAPRARFMTSLAEKAGIDRSSLFRVVNGDEDEAPETLMKIAEALGLDPMLRSGPIKRFGIQTGS